MVPLTPRKMPRQTRTWIQAILLKSVRILQKLNLEIENNVFETNAVFIPASLYLLSLYLCFQLFSGRFALHHLFQKLYTCVWFEINVETKFYPHPLTFASQQFLCFLFPIAVFFFPNWLVVLADVNKLVLAQSVLVGVNPIRVNSAPALSLLLTLPGQL